MASTHGPYSFPSAAKTLRTGTCGERISDGDMMCPGTAWRSPRSLGQQGLGALAATALAVPTAATGCQCAPSSGGSGRAVDLVAVQALSSPCSGVTEKYASETDSRVWNLQRAAALVSVGQHRGALDPGS